MASRSPNEPEVIVAGGGPAGAAAARLLALWGRRVLLFTRSSGSRGTLAESLPPSIRKLFDTLRITSAIEGAGFQRTRGNTVWWTRTDERVLEFPDGSGWQVERRRFDALLLELAAEAGAHVYRRATVQEVDVESGRPEVRVRSPDPAPAGRHCAPYVLDCSGRAGILASHDLRIRTDAPRTNALVGAWRRPGGWGLPDESHTLVEGYRDGWAWSIPVDSEVRYFTAMVDPAVTDLRSERGLETMYRRELDKTSRLARLLADAEPAVPAWACGATPYSARLFAGPGFLLVGDAASFIDPLSSYGVKKALASAWLAAVVVNTLLDDPELEEEALGFFERREREAYASYVDQSTEFYAEGNSVHDHPFWSRRATGPGGGGDERSIPSAGGPGADVEALRTDPRVLRAFEGLRGASEVSLRPAGPSTLVRAPAVQGRRLVLEDRLRTPSYPGGVRYVRDVDLVALTRLATTAGDGEADVPGLYDRYRRISGPVPLPDFLGALSVLLAEDVLENVATGVHA